MRPSLITLGVWCMALALVFGAYELARALVAHKSATVASLERQIETESKSASRIAAARAALSELAGDETVVQSYFVAPAGVVALIDSLQSRGQTLGANVEVKSVAAATDTKVRPALLLSLTITGTFDAVMRTIGSIEYAPYDLAITGLSLAAGAEDAWTASVNLSVGSAATTTSAR